MMKKTGSKALAGLAVAAARDVTPAALGRL